MFDVIPDLPLGLQVWRGPKAQASAKEIKKRSHKRFFYSFSTAPEKGGGGQVGSEKSTNEMTQNNKKSQFSNEHTAVTHFRVGSCTEAVRNWDGRAPKSSPVSWCPTLRYTWIYF